MPGIEIKGRSKIANYRHGGSAGYQDSKALAYPKYFSSNKIEIFLINSKET